jgi:hypothetical protein
VNVYAELRCVAVRWVSDEPPPGWVEVLLTDADGRTWQFFDKPPIFDATGSLTSSSSFPAPVAMRVRVIEEAEPADSKTCRPMSRRAGKQISMRSGPAPERPTAPMRERRGAVRS